MKLPAVFDRLVHKAPPAAPRFLSLVLDELYVQSAVWSVGERGRPTLVASNIQRLEKDSWEARIEAGDRSFSALDQDGSVGDLHNVVLGLSSLYLTPTGDIDPKARLQVKNLCKELDLTAIGFVSLPQALMNKLKTDEGVPPTVILLAVSDGKVTVSLYKVGMLAGQATIDADEIVAQLEVTLKSWKDIEVLPSRMLLYGTDAVNLEELRNTLLKHPWPTRVSFLHFPKIDILPKTFGVEAVSLAGAGEMAEGLGAEVDTGAEVLESEVIAGGEPVAEEESNVVMVEPESLGFAKGRDVLEKVQSEQEDEKEMQKRKVVLPKFVIPSISFDRVGEVFRSIHLPIGGLPIVGFLVIVILLVGLYLWFIPHALVTIQILPKVLEKTTTLTVNPTATVADSATKMIPGKNQEKVVSGEKTMAVAGKKDIGDPAKGTVTIYNRSLSSQQLKKGIALNSGTLSFTLDDDVSVASASVGIDYSINPSKANATITAVKLGSQGNVSGSTEFSVKDISTSTVIARNEKPFTGGSSKEVTVVSRADYDALVKVLTADLVEKAKAELASGVAGKEKLIDATIKSSLTEKTFQQELDQEAKELHGKITVTVTGISYSEEDIATIFKDMVSGEIPSGYVLMSEQTTMKVSNMTMKKDGSISLAVTMHGAALPTLNSADIAKDLAAKSAKKAEEYLRSITGVSGMGVDFRWSPLKILLPFNKNNISISITLQE
jgi:hypothetical protein